MSFTATAGAANPPSQVLTIGTTGSTAPTWTILDNAAWLSVGASSGTGSQGISVSVTTAGLAAGTYTGAITVSSAGTSNGSVVVPVNLTLTAPAPAPTPNLSVTPSSLSFTVQAGTTANTAAQPLTIANAGGGTLSWTVSDPVAWLQQSVSSGTGAGSTNVWVNPTGLAAGSYNTSITVTSSGATNSPRVIPVSLTVTAASPPPQPTMALAPSALTFSGVQGGANPATQTITVTNAGSGTLTWSVSDNVAWLTATQSGNTILASVSLTGLAAGTYPGVITITASGATNTPQTIPVTLTVTAPVASPSLAVSPASLSFSVPTGSTPSAAQTFTVSNAGGGTLNWAASHQEAWISRSAATGTNTGSISVTVNPSGLTAGTYTGHIMLWSNEANNSPATVTISMTVTGVAPQPTIALSPSGLTFSGTAGGSNPASQNITVSNSGAGTLTWSVADNASWLTATQSGNSIVAAVSTTGLAAGTYNASITVTASGATNTPQTIPVTLTVTAPVASPSLAVSPASLSFSVPTGSTPSAAQTFTVSNAGGGTLNWAASHQEAWISRNGASGTNTGSISVTVNPSGLTAGTYTGHIMLWSNEANNSPATVTISMTVTGVAPQPTIALSPSSLAFSGTTGGSNPASKSVTVSNSGAGTLTWSVADNASWLTATQSGNSIVAAVSTTGLAAGTYNASITVTASGATNTPQTIPVSLTLTAPPASQTATLTWNPNGEQDLAGYKIYRATSSGAYGAPIATIQGNSTSYTAMGLQPGTTYFFTVTAYDNAGNESGFSNEVSKSIY